MIFVSKISVLIPKPWPIGKIVLIRIIKILIFKFFKRLRKKSLSTYRDLFFHSPNCIVARDHPVGYFLTWLNHIWAVTRFNHPASYFCNMVDCDHVAGGIEKDVLRRKGKVKYEIEFILTFFKNLINKLQVR